MNIKAFRDEVRLRLTGGLLDLELDDVTIDKLINISLRELQRYVCSTKFVTVPFEKCIDLSKVKDDKNKKIKVSSVSRIYRSTGFIASDESNADSSMIDPVYASQWQLMSGLGTMYNFQNYMYDFASWNTLLQIRNTTSTDLSFRYDKSSNKLYINFASSTPNNITIEYVPRYDSVSEISSDYWIDMLARMTVANAKIAVGRIRSRYTQTGALWTQDGDKILEEGNSELTALREYLAQNANLIYPVD